MAKIALAIGPAGGDGTPIALRKGDSASWGLSYGVDPFFSEVETSWARARAILDASLYTFEGGSTKLPGQAGPLAIYIRPSQGRDRTYRNVFALTMTAGSTPQMARLLLVDSRYWWRYRLVEASFNVARSTGDRRLVGGALVAIPNQQNLEDFDFRRVSLNSGEPWTAREALDHVMQRLQEPGSYEIPDSAILQTDFTDGVHLHDPGHLALDRILQFLPGVQPFQKEDGLITFGNVYSGEEEEVALDFIGTQNAGSVRIADRSAVRSRLFRVHFRKEQEFRADFVDRGGESDPGESVNRDQPEPIFFNVIECPLYELPLPSGETATQGEFLRLPVFLDAFNALRLTKAVRQDVGNLTQADLRTCWLGKPEVLLETFARLANGQEFDGDTSLMLGALQAHWRQTFRLDPAFTDRFRGIKASRVAIISPENSATSLSPVYTQWVEKINQQGISARAPSGEYGIPHDDWAEDLANAKAAPFVVTMVNSDAGIFRVTPQVHQRREASDYVIGVPDGPLPTSKLADVGALDFWHEVSLAPDFKMSVILSGIQDSPNNKSRLHTVEVTAEQAANEIGQNLPEDGLAPDMEITIDLDSARFAWIQEQRDLTLQGIWGTTPEEDEETEGQVDLAEVALVNRERIEDLARAAAGVAVAPMLDRVQGTLVVSHLHDVQPTGNLKTVVFTVSLTSEGNATVLTTLEFPGEVQAPPIYSILPEQTRRVLRGQVQQ